MYNKFGSQHVVVTRGIISEMKKSESFDFHVKQALSKHFSGDWGDVCEEDKQTNEDSLKNNGRLMSAYKQTPFPEIWIITEWDRSVTTVLFPDEY